MNTVLPQINYNLYQELIMRELLSHYAYMNYLNSMCAWGTHLKFQERRKLIKSVGANIL